MRAICILFFLPALLRGQDFKKDMQEASRYLYSLKNYSLLMHYKLYVDDELTRPYQERKVEVKRMGKCFLMKEDDGTELISNERFLIRLNNKTREMQAQKLAPGVDSLSGEKGPDPFSDVMFKRVEGMYNSVKLLSLTDERVSYEVLFKPGSPVEKMLLVINRKTRLFESVRSCYRKRKGLPELGEGEHQVTVDVIYSGLALNVMRDAALFDERRYVVEDKGVLRVSAGYKGFKLK